ncbi:hypothetical protein TSOC_000612 [Tetrabaena socialis]|uniref:Apple domain-containing protein n=1 Tax=Tetrabaena socialis TaxID=47790 RepID=A0A2J8AIZ8_9CHLO|nr:hypothetical protein TSOC_000612 [Tetrabaena socialis]|eukprot:PNH12485.1 hypothetical protein TSOC_000612 [Tetrabaena socialis]
MAPRLLHPSTTGLLLALALLVARAADGAQPQPQAGGLPRAVVAVANRDAEGAVVVDADAAKNYQPTAAACRDQCVATKGCNVWVWCGAVDGCSSGGSSGQGNAGKYRQCWLKYDIPAPGGRLWPRYKNSPDQATGWTSGTTDAKVADAAPRPERTYSCPCKPDFTQDGYRFLGVCAAMGEYGSKQCKVDATCSSGGSNSLQGCSDTTSCTVFLDTDLAESKVLVSGDGNTAGSAEDCCSQCGKTRGCNVWSWCSDSRGCGGEVFRFRQCWLKQADPLNPAAKAGYGGSPGWVSGEGPPPRAVIAVAGRDAEGAVLVDADQIRNFKPTASACRDQCVATAGCNVWVWCGTHSGCTSAGYRDTSNAGNFAKCWLKCDNPIFGGGLWPRYKNAIDQATGWTSGTTDPRVNDSAPVPERSYSCSCQSNYTADGYRFLGCPEWQPTTVLLDTDLQEDKVLVSADAYHNTAGSAEDCSNQCGKTRGCNVWSWCSDGRGCNGDSIRFRQCWLKQVADPLHPVAKAGYGGSPGWVSGEGPPPRAVVAVANRDAEGAVVVDADETKNYQPTAAACRDDCNATAGCNVWVWCGEVSGCSSGGGNGQGNAGKYRQCWLKYDIPPSGGRLWPRYKNAIDQATGWTSGTTDPRVNDSAPVPERSYSCSCQSNYTADGYRFLGVCAALGDYSNNQCMVDASCGGNYYNGNLQGCTWTQPCTVLLDTDLAEDKVLVWGDGNTADSAEDCSGQCGRTRGCNLWTWCSDARGCSGEVYRFRQCWLKQADPLHPVAKAGYGGSPGWVSGVRLAYLPV